MLYVLVSFCLFIWSNWVCHDCSQSLFRERHLIILSNLPVNCLSGNLIRGHWTFAMTLTRSENKFARLGAHCVLCLDNGCIRAHWFPAPDCVCVMCILPSHKCQVYSCVVIRKIRIFYGKFTINYGPHRFGLYTLYSLFSGCRDLILLFRLCIHSWLIPCFILGCDSVTHGNLISLVTPASPSPIWDILPDSDLPMLPLGSSLHLSSGTPFTPGTPAPFTPWKTPKQIHSYCVTVLQLKWYTINDYILLSARKRSETTDCFWLWPYQMHRLIKNTRHN